MDGWERIGESDGFGWLILGMLEQAGWRVYVRAGFAGEGVMILGTHPDLAGVEVCESGATVAGAAVPFFERCVTHGRTIGARACP